MPYPRRYGRRPGEYASKASHGHIVQDESVQKFLKQCILPRRAEEVNLSEFLRVQYQPVDPNPIRYVIAIDGGYTEIAVQEKFPSSTIAFFQFGALFFDVEHLISLEDCAFIDPDHMTALKNMQRLEFTFPVRNLALRSEGTLYESARRSIYDFFRQDLDGDEIIETLKWLIYQEYSNPRNVWALANCPRCRESTIPLLRSEISSNYTFECPHCHNEIYLTDVFRLHEWMDNEIGAGSVLGYLTNVIEQMLYAHLIRIILKIKPDLLNRLLVIRDGPLAFFGPTARMHIPFRNLIGYLFDHHNLYLAGLEKSGAFVEHADEIYPILEPGTALILDNDYIYEYIIPGQGDPARPYGSTSYFGNKLIFKAPTGHIYVATLPTIPAVNQAGIAYPSQDDFRNLQAILTNIELLRCDMYDNALVPVALANKLVSLANHPSSRILQRFAKESIQQNR
jgi:hypothetical protein